MKDLLLELLKGAKKDNRNKKRIGVVSKKILELHEEKADFDNDLQEEMDLRIRQLALESKNKIKAEFGPRIKQYEKMHEEAWAKTYEELNLDPTKDYNINRKEGVVYQYYDENNSPIIKH